MERDRQARINRGPIIDQDMIFPFVVPLLQASRLFWTADMAKPFPLNPKHPERICWGCDKYCSVDSLSCGNGSSRTQHPAELIGEDWYKWGDWGIADPAAKESERPVDDL